MISPHLQGIITDTKPIFCCIIAYLLGSIPTGYLMGRFFYHKDIRLSGSGNIGATNAQRTFGTGAGVLVLAIDILKAVAAIVITRQVLKTVPGAIDTNMFIALAGILVILGHIFPVWLRFKGGKGVGVAAGVFVALSPGQLFIALILFVFLVSITKYISLSSLLAAIGYLLMEVFSQYIMGFPDRWRLLLVFLVVALIIYRHMDNIRRLTQGTEPKFSFGKKPQAE